MDTYKLTAGIESDIRGEQGEYNYRKLHKWMNYQEGFWKGISGTI